MKKNMYIFLIILLIFSSSPNLILAKEKSEKRKSKKRKSEEASEEEAIQEETEQDETTQAKSTMLMSQKVKIEESRISRLGHIRGGERYIYESIGGKSFKAAPTYTNAVYYIKRQAKVESEIYYLLSQSPSDTRGVVGWMKASDLTSLAHVGVSKTPKQLLLNGKGKATRKAWGGSKDTVHASMDQFKGRILEVNLTEKVGTNIWYRGKINGNGSNIWVHSSQTSKMPKITESRTSQLGHIRSGERYIYESIFGKPFKAAPTYTNAVYYIKRQAKVESETYYLLSQSPSDTRGVVGWMRASDLSTHAHVGVSKTPKQLLLNGKGKATRKAWGGSKDTVHASMDQFKGQIFEVNLTEKVGTNIWYRGKIDGQGANVWLHSSQADKVKEIVKETDYRLSLNQALSIQTKPERTHFIMYGSHGFIAKSRINQTNEVIGTTNVRTMPQTESNLDNKVIKTLPAGTKISPIGEIGAWYAIEVGGSRKVTALSHQIRDRLDPRTAIHAPVNKFQFLDLRVRTGLTSIEMNRELLTSGILQGQGQAFNDASRLHGINEMYLIVHARLETGNGTSALSNGTYEVGLDSNGNPQLVTPLNRLLLTDIKKTYNMFGIGAIDTNPAEGGAIRAYNEGWFTPTAAIVGGAQWIKDGYIYNEHNQNTLYKMRWNPNMVDGYAWKQYATDIDWALKKAKLIYDIYTHIDKDKILTFDRPIYR